MTVSSSTTIRPNRRTAAVAAGILLAAASLSACGSSGTIRSASSGGTSGGVAESTTTTPTQPPTTPAMSTADYSTALTGVNTALGADYSAILSASTDEQLKDALSKLSGDATAELVAIPDNPPTAAADANTKLTTALNSLATAASSTSDDVGTKVCTAGSAAAELTRSDGAGALRDAATALAAADPSYKDTVAKFLPAPIADQNRQLSNGKVLRKSSGPGSLEVDSADEDAVVTLTITGSKTPTASIYVRANSKATLSGIPGKTFDAYITSGSDWDSAAGKFTRDCSFGKADDTFDFSTSDWSLTLSKQVGGNLSVTDLGADDAPKP